jgi:hypothetical protein
MVQAMTLFTAASARHYAVHCEGGARHRPSLTCSGENSFTCGFVVERVDEHTNDVHLSAVDHVCQRITSASAPD